MKSADPVIYDCVFIGTGVIASLEAVYQSRCGKSVLMIDRAPEVGGCWAPLEIFGFTGVENAIHYFLPDPRATRFMAENLGWKVVRSSGKYRVFPKAVLGLRKMPYDSRVGKALAEWSRVGKGHTIGDAVGHIWRVLLGGRIRSEYVDGGTAEIVAKMKSLLAQSTVETRNDTRIDKVVVRPDQARVVLHVSDRMGSRCIEGRRAFVTHGALIHGVEGPTGFLELKEKKHPRPALHLLLRNAGPVSVNEAIFVENPLIKYAHDVTKYASKGPAVADGQRVIVLALHSTVSRYDDVAADVCEILKAANVVASTAVVVDHYWTDVFLPSLNDSDLDLLVTSFPEQLSVLRTENFAVGIGANAERWATRIIAPESGITRVGV